MHKRVICLLQSLHYMLREQVFVLFCEAIHVIDHISSDVIDLELECVPLAGLLVVRMGRLLQVKLMELAQEVLVVTAR